MSLLKITAAAVLALSGLAQAETTFVRDNAEIDVRVILHDNGTATGTVVNKQGHGSSTVAGIWTMDASGKRCVDLNLPDFRMKWNECGVVRQ
jgi:hypothetical protein